MRLKRFRKINEQYKYLNNWPKWITDSMTLKDIKDIANSSGNKNIISKAIDNRV